MWKPVSREVGSHDPLIVHSVLLSFHCSIFRAIYRVVAGLATIIAQQMKA